MTNTIEILLGADELEGTEATVSQWLFKEGELIQSGEPIVELETDKVSMEICAPKTGILHQILINNGEAVEIDAVLGTLVENTTKPNEQEIISKNKNGLKISTEEPAIYMTGGVTSDNDNNARNLLSPAVKRLLTENNLDSKSISGTGKNGRINRDDVLRFLAENKSTPSSKMVQHTKMRKSIANKMVESLLQISPHVTSVFEMNMNNVINHRNLHKNEFAKQGVNLTFTAYFLAASVAAIRQAPEINARFHEDAMELFNDINIGVVTALGEKGLVVPVVEQVQTKNLFEIAEALTRQTEKARKDDLKPADMKNGTFTISNHGVSGSLFAAPIIINQPEVAILGIGKLEKRLVVEEINQQDTIQIKPMCYVSLSIDHRALDAYHTTQFLSAFVETIETWGQ